MKKYTLLFLCIIFVYSCTDSTKTAEPDELQGKLSADLVNNPNTLEGKNIIEGPIIRFTDTLHDFGRLKEGESVEYEFSFTNQGKMDLIITEAKGSCGCTVPTFSNKPIKRGEQGSIKVTFNSQGKKGYNEKSVVVISNANPSVSNLYIQAEVQ